MCYTLETVEIWVFICATYVQLKGFFKVSTYIMCLNALSMLSIKSDNYSTAFTGF